MVIVGFDPGIATLGYGVIQTDAKKKPIMLDYGIISTPKDENLAVRLCMLEKGVKQIQIDNKTTAVGELIAKWPVYSSGEEGNAGGVKGHLIMQVYKCRITQMPGFDTSYKSAATNSVTFSTVESRAHEHAYSIAYYELPQAA